MELKRVFSKRMRARKTNTPDSIELPPRKFGDFFMPSAPSGHGAPATPSTPSIEEFVSIAFEDQPPSELSSPSRRLSSSSTRNSRSASLASLKEHPSLAPTASPKQPLQTPELEVPPSPRSLSEEPDNGVDEMAQHILDKAQKGNQKWSL